MPGVRSIHRITRCCTSPHDPVRPRAAPYETASPASDRPVVPLGRTSRPGGHRADRSAVPQGPAPACPLALVGAARRAGRHRCHRVGDRRGGDGRGGDHRLAARGVRARPGRGRQPLRHRARVAEPRPHRVHAAGQRLARRGRLGRRRLHRAAQPFRHDAGPQVARAAHHPGPVGDLARRRLLRAAGPDRRRPARVRRRDVDEGVGGGGQGRVDRRRQRRRPPGRAERERGPVGRAQAGRGRFWRRRHARRDLAGRRPADRQREDVRLAGRAQRGRRAGEHHRGGPHPGDGGLPAARRRHVPRRGRRPRVDRRRRRQGRVPVDRRRRDRSRVAPDVRPGPLVERLLVALRPDRDGLGRRQRRLYREPAHALPLRGGGVDEEGHLPGQPGRRGRHVRLEQGHPDLDAVRVLAVEPAHPDLGQHELGQLRPEHTHLRHVRRGHLRHRGLDQGGHGRPARLLRTGDDAVQRQRPRHPHRQLQPGEFAELERAGHLQRPRGRALHVAAVPGHRRPGRAEAVLPVHQVHRRVPARLPEGRRRRAAARQRQRARDAVGRAGPDHRHRGRPHPLPGRRTRRRAAGHRPDRRRRPRPAGHRGHDADPAVPADRPGHQDRAAQPGLLAEPDGRGGRHRHRHDRDLVPAGRAAPQRREHRARTAVALGHGERPGHEPLRAGAARLRPPAQQGRQRLVDGRDRRRPAGGPRRGARRPRLADRGPPGVPERVRRPGEHRRLPALHRAGVGRGYRGRRGARAGLRRHHPLRARLAGRLGRQRQRLRPGQRQGRCPGAGRRVDHRRDRGGQQRHAAGQEPLVRAAHRGGRRPHRPHRGRAEHRTACSTCPCGRGVRTWCSGPPRRRAPCRTPG